MAYHVTTVISCDGGGQFECDAEVVRQEGHEAEKSIRAEARSKGWRRDPNGLWLCPAHAGST